MNPTTYLLAAITALSLWGAATPATPAPAAAPAVKKVPARSPHAEAIQLVMATRPEEVRKVERDDWWHDVAPRGWIAQRPFHPGVIDSTHLFVVTCQIDGKAALSWTVDTRRGTVETRGRAGDEADPRP